MKVLFAVSNESISEAIVKKYQQMYKEIISSKNVYYFNAIIKELQKDKSYDRIVVSEDLEPFASKNYDTIDNFIFEKLDSISDEASNVQGEDIPIILISTDRRTKGENILVKLFGIGVYSALIGQDRSIEQVCNLINKPRSKKEAKIYYKISSNEVEYKAESEGNVSEIEIQNILAHYKKLGKNEEKYVESFNSIANQYTDGQLRLIIKFLPLNVKAVLEANCPKYQQVVAYSGEANKQNEYRNPQSRFNKKQEKQQKTDKKAEKAGLKIESLKTEKNSAVLSKPVIIPTEVTTENVKKVTTKQNTPNNQIQQRQVSQMANNQVNQRPQMANTQVNQKPQMANEQVSQRPQMANAQVSQRPQMANEQVSQRSQVANEQVSQRPQMANAQVSQNPQIANNSVIQQIPKVNSQMNQLENNEIDQTQQIPTENNVQVQNVQGDSAQPKRGRGRPKKNVTEENTVQEDLQPKRGRGRPKKVQQENVSVADDNFTQNVDDTLPGFDDYNANSSSFEQNDDGTLPGFDDYNSGNNAFEQNNDTNKSIPEQNNSGTLSSTNKYTENNNDMISNYNFNHNYNNTNTQEEQITTQTPINSENTSTLVNGNQKIVGFVGTSKNGTSFIVDNLAQILSRQGIKTAILDLTQNKNAYYIYTKNEEELRKKAMNCMERLQQGVTEGIKVNPNLDVYTSVPGADDQVTNTDNIVNTLLGTYSLVLVDCDFKSDYRYISRLQELYLVQSMDVLTIQPLTAYLRDLKAKGVLDQNKLKIIINKYVRVRSLTEKTIIGGMAFYNDPAMSFMTELFNRETIKYTVIPFDSQAYSKYLEGLVNCEISTDGYSKEILMELRKLANMVYPLIANGARYERANKNQKNQYGQYDKGAFSPQMNSTLNRMKKKY